MTDTINSDNKDKKSTSDCKTLPQRLTQEAVDEQNRNHRDLLTRQPFDLTDTRDVPCSSGVKLTSTASFNATFGTTSTSSDTQSFPNSKTPPSFSPLQGGTDTWLRLVLCLL